MGQLRLGPVKDLRPIDQVAQLVSAFGIEFVRLWYDGVINVGWLIQHWLLSIALSERWTAYEPLHRPKQWMHASWQMAIINSPAAIGIGH